MIGILLVNLGTPDAPETGAVRRYLREFLSDPRVVEIPRLLWWPILNGSILLTRPARSARAYARVWMPEGSPLLVYSQRQSDGLAALLQERFHGQVRVELGMRYGNPAVAAGLAALRQQGCERILLVPLYPQYAAATTASTFDAVAAALRRQREIPELRMIRDWHDHPAYIAALAGRVRSYWQAHGQPDRLLISFHGLPERCVALGDPYRRQCERSTELLVAELGLPRDAWVQTFQSRFGPAKWLGPYTDQTLQALARAGVGRVDCFCPGFAADCLETLEEIAMTGKESFLHAGGKEMHYIPALNDDPAWVEALASILLPHLEGWELAPQTAAGPGAVKDFAVSAMAG